ncbi:MAG TPA: pimeloyl-ACP methyl ester esterase BioH [Steroidobacteraceae bacterium]|nr:pimeloyl-ACP methyl ester esterase BioH [Steroidobacteraceae bacterium]
MTALHVEILGRGADLVLLHGWSLHGGMWGPWIEALAQHARLHVVDLPGHGRSPWPQGVHDLGGLAQCVRPSIPDGAVVLGWSLGGMVALELARRHPATVAALVLIATTPRFLTGAGWEQGMRPEVLEGFARGLAEDYRATVRNFLALQALGDERAAQALRVLRDRLASHGEPDPRALAAGLRMLREADLREALPGITQPTLVIAGERDRVTPPAAGLELAAALPAARYCAIAGAGHAPFLSHAQEVLRELRPFLARHLGRVTVGEAAGGPHDA